MRVNLPGIVAACATLAFTPAGAFKVLFQNNCPDVVRTLHTGPNTNARLPISPGHNATFPFSGPYAGDTYNRIFFGRGNQAPANGSDYRFPEFDYYYQNYPGVPERIEVLIYAGNSHFFEKDDIKMRDLSTTKTYDCPKFCCNAFCPYAPDNAPFNSYKDRTVKVTLCAK